MFGRSRGCLGGLEDVRSWIPYGFRASRGLEHDVHASPLFGPSLDKREVRCALVGPARWMYILAGRVDVRGEMGRELVRSLI